LIYTLGVLNSNFYKNILKITAPTVNTSVGDVLRLPIIFPKIQIKEKVENLTQQNIDISKEEWDSRETSWDFAQNEILRILNDEFLMLNEKENNSKFKIQNLTLETIYNRYCEYWREKFYQLHQNEEELNRLFIDIYELQDELTPDVELKDITILKNEAKIIDNELVFQPNEIVKQFISYAVGIMFGRYSLDHEGLHIANMNESLEDANLKFNIQNPTFEIDDDNIIPIVDESDYFSDGYGFVVDYIAEILRHLRNDDYSNRYQEYFTLSKNISTRDRDGINKTFSGLMKILHPDNNATVEEIEEILKFAIEGRKRVKDQLMRIDSTYANTEFYYEDNSGKKYLVTTLEEDEYPNYYHKRVALGSEEDNETIPTTTQPTNNPSIKSDKETQELKEQHLSFKENQKGITYNSLFGPYIKGSHKITLTDPYVRIFFQIRNLMEFIETIITNKVDEESILFHLITIADERTPENQLEYFKQIQLSAQNAGVIFTWEFDTTQTIHARNIVTDTGWKISLDRGLDIFQQYAMNDTFSLSNRLQEYRSCKAFEITYIKLK